LDPLMIGILAEIMVELISILSLTKKHVHRGRLSKWVLAIVISDYL
jgi:hypothetical protein